MAQGSIQWNGKYMLNCRESSMRIIGDKLAKIVPQNELVSIRKLVSHWNEELLTMPPGCSNVKFDRYLKERETIQIFLTYLHSVMNSTNPQTQPIVSRLLPQIILLLEEGFEYLDDVYRGNQI